MAASKLKVMLVEDDEFTRATVKSALQSQGINIVYDTAFVKDGIEVGRGWNKVTSTNDPTAHAEIIAIRDACKNLQTHQLDGCEIYTSCEPCPMCLGAIYWARPSKVYYANTRLDAAAIGFDDSLIYNELTLSLPERKLSMELLFHPDAPKVFEAWKKKDDKIKY